MDEGVTHIELLGERHGIQLPLYAEREELAVAWAEARTRTSSVQLRVASAALGLCTRIGRRSGADYAACRCDVLTYGGRVYGWLREHGATPSAIKRVGDEVLVAVAGSLAPREHEVAEKLDFSAAGGVGST